MLSLYKLIILIILINLYSTYEIINSIFTDKDKYLEAIKV